ncbi:putative efflux pump antibiotic resistance protein [Pseudomassariella vexata]|uniref:Putative efflux pump antibiotic resistance protein n=1 Tax=Pseudomassariella vexata TaxID=1141098 RepID=A0A1Y2DHM5_9PEZI|nr:putative efflux pump antibiotic resistance protein [Pseudomassariella vexata]ORY58749.1 putative efflux pump antibiotic resistance protein [Pseudomassariella vexata]
MDETKPANKTQVASTADLDAPEAPPRRSKPGERAGLTVTQFWIVCVGLNAGMLLTALDFNIVATAVPIISSEFNNYSNSAWLGTAFLITFALGQPIAAKLGDVFGRKNIFLGGTVLFFVGSALCGWAHNMDMLIWSRAVQGLGAGVIYVLTNVVIITDLVDLQDVGKFLAITGIVWALADVAGPLLGGVFSQYATWRWCFWINLFICPVSFAIVLFTLHLPVPNMSLKEKLLTFDYVGTIAISGATTALNMGLSWGGHVFPWTDSRVIGTIVGGAALFVTFIVVEHFVKVPLVFPSMFRSRALLSIFGAEFFYGIVLLGGMYYLPQYFQLVFGDSATLSGIGLLPMMLGLLVGNPIAAFVTSKKGVSLINAIAGAALEVMAMGLMTRWNASTTRAEAVIVPFILGVGQGAAMSGMLLTAQVAVVPMQIGVVTGLCLFIQAIGDAFGIALFSAVYVNELADGLANLGLTPAEVSGVMADIHTVHTRFSADLIPRIVDIYAHSLQNGWWLLFGAACACFICCCVGKQHKFMAPEAKPEAEEKAPSEV